LKQQLARSLAVFACAAALLIASCSRPVGSSAFVAIEHEISPEPARVGPATVSLRLADSAAKPEAKETDHGRYEFQLEFPMAGDWVILLHVTLPDGKKLERQFDVRGVRPN
jgi:hypothetical protein